jgi:hypothetical protein
MAEASDPPEIKAEGIAIAGGAVAVDLLEALVDKNILTLAESHAVLERSIATTALHFRTPEGAEATKIIGSLMRDRFSTPHA